MDKQSLVQELFVLRSGLRLSHWQIYITTLPTTSNVITNEYLSPQTCSLRRLIVARYCKTFLVSLCNRKSLSGGPQGAHIRRGVVLSRQLLCNRLYRVGQKC